ncbi:MAG: carbamoyltransferase HypF, partial [Alphaproteobacteria bacterium]|nr:carbamoyltransferase HypF [Alphaproteobacteria bacterium]
MSPLQANPTPRSQPPAPGARRRWQVTGQVQGVGFRPFVYRLARRLGLSGFVRNDGHGVTMEAQGPDPALDRFQQALTDERPPLARVDRIAWQRLAVDPRPAARTFEIRTSDAGADRSAAVTVDTALCRDCRDELLSTDDRRRGYALINCTHCGPRYSIVRRVPYDRPNTTMAGFAMCRRCAAEYADPTDRRFHAQPVACHACGPDLTLVDACGSRLPGDPIRQAAARLHAGHILAIKGLGGFHLAVRADDARAVAELRRRKQRDAKPLAVMCRDLDHARELVELSDTAAEVMQSPACPIVLAPRAQRSHARIADRVAPGTHRLGVMLPYTPIHHLLLAVTDPPPGPLVMTSANLSDEPLVTDNAQALRRLGAICDAILWHDRPIARCVDDSVLLDMATSAPLPVRRARGYVPTPIGLPAGLGTPPDGLCLGGELKNTVAGVRTRDRAAGVILSAHHGDLTHPLAYEAFCRSIDDLLDLFDIQPRWLAHDLHPVYMSTRHARRLAAERNLPLIAVQHHHAHAAAVMAEHGRSDRTLAVVCDGVGYGTDGTSWGGELLAAEPADFQRLASLRAMRLPGGDAAARDTRRS